MDCWRSFRPREVDWSPTSGNCYPVQMRWAGNLFIVAADLRKRCLDWNCPWRHLAWRSATYLLAWHLVAFRNLDCPFGSLAFARAWVGTVIFVDSRVAPIRSLQSCSGFEYYFQWPCYRARSTCHWPSARLSCTSDTSSEYLLFAMSCSLGSCRSACLQQAHYCCLGSRRILRHLLPRGTASNLNYWNRSRAYPWDLYYLVEHLFVVIYRMTLNPHLLLRLLLALLSCYDLVVINQSFLVLFAIIFELVYFRPIHRH